MKNLFDPGAPEDVKRRVLELRADSVRQWGRMTVAQMLAHLANAFEMAVGDARPPRMFAGRILGGLGRAFVLGNDKPMLRNTATVPMLSIVDPRDLERERARLLTLMDRFTSGGPAGVTTHPHSFFGRMTPQQWAVLMYKHLDHHLRQFGV
ncbi:MAG TPA: DUF1569 domain-containing protein [Thermoanaerobaculia bacterium]